MNTVTITHPNRVGLSDSYLGRLFSSVNGKPMAIGSTESYRNTFQNWLRDLMEEAFNEPQDLDVGGYFDRRQILEHKYTQYALAYQTVFGQTPEIRDNLRSQYGFVMQKVQLAYLQRVGEKSRRGPDEYACKRIQAKGPSKSPVVDAPALCLPIPDSEERAIKKQLAALPTFQKRKAHYEMLAKQMDKLVENHGSNPIRIKVLGENFTVHDLDGQKYQFIGCAGSLDDTVSDYNGYCSGQWPYLCTSIIDEDQPFFQEGYKLVFQVLSVDPEALFHCSPMDLQSPISGMEEQEQWFHLSKRMEPVIATIEQAYNQMLVGSDCIPSQAALDRFMRLGKNKSVLIAHLRKLKSSSSGINKEYLKEVIGILYGNDFNKIKKAILFLGAKGLIDPSVVDEQVEMLQEYESLCTQFPQLLSPDLYEEDHHFNRVSLQVSALVAHFKDTRWTFQQQKSEFIRLFGKEDPTGKYDIIHELASLEDQLRQIPVKIGLFPSRMNRLLGPTEALSESMHGVHNEFNLNVYRGKGIQVKAWIISKDDLQSRNPRQIEVLKLMLRFAEMQKIPVFIRTNPANE